MTEKAPTVLVVGAGVLQAPLIERARQRGCRVVAVDRNPNAPGFAFAHVAAPIDTSDVEAVVELARAESADGVLTVGSDVALPAVSAVARELGFVGPSGRAVTLARDKAAQWELFRKLGAARRQCVAATTLEGLVAAAGSLRFPVVVKPTDGAGGRGGRVVREQQEVAKSVEVAVAASRAGRALVEEFVEGSDHTAEAFVLDGRRCFGVITDKELGPPGLVPREHAVPTGLSADAQVAVWDAVDALCQEIGLEWGPLDVDFKMTAHGPELLEFAPRLGGNELPRLLERASGISLMDWALSVALGLPVGAETYEVKPRAVRILFSGKSGWVEELAATEPGWTAPAEVSYDVRPGDRVRSVTCSADRVGFVLAGGSTAQEARGRVRQTADRCEGGLRVSSDGL